MKTKVNKIVKAIAVGIFFMALFFNVKVSLEDPFLRLSNEVFAQSSSGNTPATCESECKYSVDALCSFSTVDHNGTPIIASCPHYAKK